MKLEIIHGQRIACYDNAKTADRYTVIYRDQPERSALSPHRYFSAVAMSAKPFHPQGFGQHTACVWPVPRSVGKRIPFSSLPIDCQTLVNNDLKP